MSMFSSDYSVVTVMVQSHGTSSEMLNEANASPISPGKENRMYPSVKVCPTVLTSSDFQVMRQQISTKEVPHLSSHREAPVRKVGDGDAAQAAGGGWGHICGPWSDSPCSGPLACRSGCGGGGASGSTIVGTDQPLPELLHPGRSMCRSGLCTLKPV